MEKSEKAKKLRALRKYGKKVRVLWGLPRLDCPGWTGLPARVLEQVFIASSAVCVLVCEQGHTLTPGRAQESCDSRRACALPPLGFSCHTCVGEQCSKISGFQQHP